MLLARGIADGHASELLPIGLVCDVLFGEEGADPEPALMQAATRLEPLLDGHLLIAQFGLECRSE